MLITDPIELQRFHACHRVWQGIPGIARTKGGRTFLSFFSGETRETYGNYAVVIRSDNDKDFTEPVVAAEKPGRYRCFDPCLWIDPLQRLWFIWNVMPGEEVFASICEDPDARELVWSEEFYVGRGVMINKPLVLSSGEWLFPIAVWRTDIYHNYRKTGLRADEESGAFVYKTSDNGRSFVKLGGAQLRDRAFDEHMILEMENGVLRMLVRLNRGIGESYSYDRGKTWSRGQHSGLDGPCARFFVRKLRSGRVLLINHHDFQDRNNLTAMLSEDDGTSFPYRLLLDARPSVAYPDAMECDDGYIYIVYDHRRGCFKGSLEEAYQSDREILIARITEQDILHGALCSEGSYLGRVACRLGKLAEGDPDPFARDMLEEHELAQDLIESGEEDPISRIFERYPINCVNVCDFDAQSLDAQIARFQESGSKDVALLTQIIRFIRSTPKRVTETYPVIDKIQALIDKHLDEEMPVSVLAERLKISVYYLSHLFKTVTGISVTEYRNELRLTRAKQLLIHTQYSIGDIAQRVGFCSAAYFTELFSRFERIPPSEYRRLHGK